MVRSIHRNAAEGAMEGWDALELWKEDEYLSRALGAAPLSVAVTPNGRADSILPCSSRWNSVGCDCFTEPMTCSMTFSEFLEHFHSGKTREGDVHYLQVCAATQ